MTRDAINMLKTLTLLLKTGGARFAEIHWLVNRWATNRNEDGTLKSVTFGGAQRLRYSSQAQKSVFRYCTDPVLGLRTITVPNGDGSSVAVTHPSRVHFERVAGRIKDSDDRTKALIIKAVYDTVVGTKGAETKAADKKTEAAARLEKAKEIQAEAEKELAAATDGSLKKAAEKKVKKAADMVQKRGVELHAAGGDVALDDEQAEQAQTKSDKGTDQVMILSDHEIDLLVQLTTESLADLAKGDEPSHHRVVKAVVQRWKAKHGDEFRSMQLGCGIEAAVFGRPSYGGGLFQSSLSAAGCAQEISVHEQRISYDTFTAIDEFKRDEGEMGAGMLGELPLAVSLNYGYMFIDIEVLRHNIERQNVDSVIAAEVVRRLILMTSLMSTKTKQGSLAAKNHSLLTLVSVGDAQPTSFADAFLMPVTTDRERPDMLVNTLDRLASFIEATDAAHPTNNVRAMALVDVSRKSTLPAVVPTILDDHRLGEWAVHAINHEPLPEQPAVAKNGTKPAAAPTASASATAE